MGKARIVSHLGDGLYSVEVLVNRERIETEIASLNARIAELDGELTALEIERAEAVAARNLAQFDLSEAVREYGIARDAAIAAGEPIPPPPDFTPLIVAVQQAAQRVQIIEAQIAVVKARRLVLVKRREQLQSVPQDVTQQAWCADLTEDLTGDVATVEVPAEGVADQFSTWRRLQLRPGFGGEAEYNPARDGQLHHRAGQSPEQVYFNAAILPGVQKWKPQYRIGTITSIDYGADTCDLDLQSEDSSAQSLIIDPPTNTLTFSGVPIQYMECNSAVFEVGDRVLVEFQNRDWQQPRVIGFEKEPKRCLPQYIVLRTSHSLRSENRNATVWTYPSSSEVASEPHLTNIAGHTLHNTLTLPALQDPGAMWNYIEMTVPEGFLETWEAIDDSGKFSKGLYFTNWAIQILWGTAQFYDGRDRGENAVVGDAGDAWSIPVGVPDEFPAGSTIKVFDPLLSNLNLYGQNISNPINYTTLEVSVDAYQFPGNFSNVDESPVGIAYGYDRIYRYKVSGTTRYLQNGVLGNTYQSGAPSGNWSRRFVGEYTLEIVGDQVEDILPISEDEIPAELTIGGTTYIRKDMGWIVNTVNANYRFAAFVYARADVADEPIEYAEGFWAED